MAQLSPTPLPQLIRNGFWQGLGWSFGATIGFVFVSSLLVILLRSMGGLPIIGGWIASIVESTQIQLIQKNPYLR